MFPDVICDAHPHTFGTYKGTEQNLSHDFCGKQQPPPSPPDWRVCGRFPAPSPASLPSFGYFSWQHYECQKESSQSMKFSILFGNRWDLINCSNKFHAFNSHPGKILHAMVMTPEIFFAADTGHELHGAINGEQYKRQKQRQSVHRLKLLSRKPAGQYC